MIPASGNVLLASGASGYLMDKSLRFRASASAYLNRTPASAGDRKKFTWSGWVKRGVLGVYQGILSGGSTSPSYDVFEFDINTNRLAFFQSGGNTTALYTNAVFRDPAAWYHIVFVYDSAQATAANRALIYVNGVLQTLTGTYPTLNLDSFINTTFPHAIGAVAASGTFIYSYDGYMAEVNFIDGQALTPSSFGSTNALTGVWQPAPYTGTYGTNGFYLPFTDNSSVEALGYSYSPNQNYLQYSEQWDNAVWLKSRIASVTANAVTAPNATLTADKVIESTATGAHHIYQGLTISSNTEVTVSTWVKAAERTSVQVSLYCRNATYVTCVVNLLDGTFTSSNSNYIYNVVPSGDGWYRISISGSNLSGTDVTRLHVFLLNASGSSSYTGDGSSGLYVWGGQINLGLAATDYVLTTSTSANTSFAVNNVSLTAGVTYDSMTDVPTLTSATAANYCVMNPIDKSPNITVSDGNLKIVQDGNSTCGRSSFFVSSNSYYAEYTVATTVGRVGVATAAIDLTQGLGVTTGGIGYDSTGFKYVNGTSTNMSAPFTTNDVIGIALNMTAQTVAFYKNNVLQFTQTGLSATSAYAFANGIANSIGNWNFGQRPFAYTPPTGFVALNTFNLPTATILKGSSVMDATLWTGNGTTTRSITNAAGFKPDLVWLKRRDAAISHVLANSVVGGGANKGLASNTTDSEASFNDDATNGYIASFDATGFSTYGTGAYTNGNGASQVAWQWQAGQGTTSSNTNGSITSTVSVNPTAGFSVVTYTGTGANATVGHGLGVAPSMIIVKDRTNGDANHGWGVYHKSTGAGGILVLNATSAFISDTTGWNNTSPTSSVFSVGTALYSNTNADSMLAYCWSEINGFSKFGSYTGNGSADGAFVYTGFRPAFVMIKGTNVVSDWVIKDDQRASNYNPQTGNLYADLSNAEDTTASVNVDFLSNGFKLRGTYSGTNGAYNYVYMAFAENPFKNSLAR